MTFTYTPATPDDITRVRFHTGDTVEAAAFHSDEEIEFMISEAVTWKPAVIMALESIILKFATEPDLKADWLSVTLGRSQAGYEEMYKKKLADFGIGRRTGRAVATYRSDSLQTEAPEDWS